MRSANFVRWLFSVSASVGLLAGCSGETPMPGPATGSGTPTSPSTSNAAAGSETADDGIEATAEGNTEPPLADVTSAVADVPSADAGSEKAAVSNVSVRVVTPAEFDEVIAKHKGKVVFVDFWATWCVPCRKAFPHTVEVAKKYPDKLAVVSVALDDADSKDDVLGFLKQQNATFENLMCIHGGADESYKAYQIPGESIPYFRIYDRDGSLKHTFGYNVDKDEGVDEAKVHEALETLIAAE
ncbi:redoxin family protein [bacterium]|nr:redoxin family protein [bacterium]